MSTAVSSSPVRPVWPAPGVADRLFPLLQKAFGYKVHIFPTANLTGRHLWTLTRPDWRQLYPILPEPLHTRYRETSGQGRTEVTTLPDLLTVPGGYVYDRRFAYASSCEDLPVGPPEQERFATPRPWSDDRTRYIRGRYHITFRIPDDWNHLGLFMVKRPRRNTGWFYPADPGGTYTTWASNGECSLAANAGWHVEVSESITFPHTKAAPRPLDVWIRRLKGIWLSLPDGDPVQDAVRDIVLQTIGGFHHHRRRETVTVPDTEEIPADAEDQLWNPTDHTLTYTHWAPLPANDQQYQFPQWSIEIWARARNRLLIRNGMGALALPRQHVLGLRTDAIYLAIDPHWEDDGKIGSFRRKAGRTGPLPAPHDARTLRAIAGGD